MLGTCELCDKKDVKVFSTFGKKKCRPCIDKNSTGRPGHSGMIYNKNVKPEDYLDIKEGRFDMNDWGICLSLVKKSHPLFVKWYIEHYPKSKGIVGRQLNYLIYYKGEPIGIIGVSSPPLNYKLFRTYFNIDNDKPFLNNNVFRIVNKPNDKNIGTKILKLLRTVSKYDYKNRYNDKLLGLVTFVEPPRTGAIYKADNWNYLGETQGIEVRRRGNNWFEKEYKKGVKKHIFAIKIK